MALWNGHNEVANVLVERSLDLELAPDVGASILRHQSRSAQEQKRQALLAQVLEVVNRANTQVLTMLVENEILQGTTLESFFQEHPFPSIYDADDPPTIDSQFATAFFDMVLDQVTLEEDCFHFIDDGQKSILEIARTIWQASNMGAVLHRRLGIWRAKYSARIQVAIEEHLLPSSKAVMMDLLDATDLESPCRQGSYLRLLPIVAALVACPERAPNQGGLMIVGQRVRDLFTRTEEAFVLTCIRKHALSILGSDIAVVSPAGEVSPGLDQFAPPDVWYFRRMKMWLKMNDDLTDVSILGRAFDMFESEDGH